MGKITDKRKVFIEQYVICGFNATEAARRAGYKYPNTEGPRLTQDEDVRAAIDERIKDIQITADEVIALLSQQARSEYAPYVTENGTVDITALVKDGKAHLVKEITPNKRGKATVKFNDSQSALALLAKYFGLTKERVEHTGKDGGKIEIDIDSESLKSEIEAKLTEAIARTAK